MKFEITNEISVYNGFLKILKANVSHESFKGKQSIDASRECMERGDSVAVLIYEIDTDSFIFTRQFRYPSARRNQPWMLELVAGSIDQNEMAEISASREVLEEIGYEVQDLQKIATYFPSPGGSSEQIHLFYTAVNSSQQVNAGGGNKEEKEDIEIVKIPRQQTKQMLLENEFNNSISLIGLQWFFLNENQ
ncbi:NUDIX domain-containing protein [Nonlabens antarcticus]|uniref:NUDIX domain-containing protein n=1 Tax=Nonlabens antarcticus TaxID=392714 RepID=UPI0018913539|nr:NUDIX domain-containing protein [Nonlabens antarcticus]